jgi:hypothetical protein
MMEMPAINIDTIPFFGGLVIQFLGLVWYGRGLVAKLEGGLKKIDELEREMKIDRARVEPIVAGWHEFKTDVKEGFRDIKSELREIRKDVKER